MRKKCMQNVSGAVSIFLAMISLLSFVSVGVMIDLARIVVSKANVEEALQLAGHSALSHYDQDLFDTYGLFAYSDLEAARTAATLSFSQTLSGKDFSSHSASFATTPLQRRLLQSKASSNLVDTQPTALSMHPVPFSALGNPAVLEAQIVEFMKLRGPIRIANGFMVKAKSFFGASEVAEVMTKKMAFERTLEISQAHIDSVDTSLSKLGPITQENVGVDVKKNLSDMKKLLEESRVALLSPQLEEVVDDSAAIQTFDQAKRIYDDTLTSLIKDVEAAKEALEKAKALNSHSQDVDAKKAAWADAIETLPVGEISQSMIGDYTTSSQILPALEIATIEEDLRRIQKEKEKQLAGWKGLLLIDKKLPNLSFQTWKDGVLHTPTLPFAELQKGFDQASLKESTTFSAEAKEGRKTLANLSGTERAGFFETIAALLERGKLINRAKKDAGDDTLRVAGTLAERGVSKDAQARYRDLRDGKQGAFDAPTWLGYGWFGSNSGISQKASSNLKEASGLLNGISAIGESIRDNAFLLAYWDGMFSSQVSEKRAEKDKAVGFRLSGEPLSKSGLYGAEKEYILFGADNLEKNQKSAKASVFGIRFLMNGIFAFTSASLRQQTGALSVAIAGWTGFGVPLVQSALLLIAAAGESALDVKDLLDGESVVIYKNDTTWRFGIQGAKEVAKDVVEDVFDKVGDLASLSVDVLEDRAKSMTSEMVNSLKRTIQDSIRGPIDQLVTRVLSAPQLTDANDIAKEVDRVVGVLHRMAQGESPSESRTLRLNALTKLKSNTGALSNAIANLVQQKNAAGQETSDVVQQAMRLVDGWMDPVIRGIDEGVERAAGFLEEKIDGALDSGEEFVSKKIEDAIDGFQKKFGTGYTTSSMGTGAGLTMHYDEYLQLLMALGMLNASGKDAMLSRTAMVMHANLDNVDLSQAPTMFVLEAKAQTKLSFTGSDFLQTDTSPLRKLADLKGLWFPIEKRSVFAY